jgi:choline dehydrogenase-like flavoprotein
MKDKKLAALRAVCDTIISPVTRTDDPDGYWGRTASDLGVPERILALISNVKAEDQADFQQLLGLLSSPLLGLTWGGPLKSAEHLTQAQLEKMLHTWSQSKLGLLRQSYASLRKATAFLYFGDIPAGQTTNPNHRTLGYQLPGLPPQTDTSPVNPLTITGDTTIDCEVLVIGSGSGGGVVAALQAAAGKDVLVVEKGPVAPRQINTMQEFPMLNRHFEAGAMLATKSGSLSILAGSTFGGGSAINWAASLRTPGDVLEEWAKDHQNPHFADPAYLRGFEFVEKRNHINTDWPHNPQNQALMDAGKQLGWKTEAIPMNLRTPDGVAEKDAWDAVGFSCLGDAQGIKQGNNETFLKDAARDGARFLGNTHIEKLTIQQGQVTGATGTVTLANGQKVAVQIRAKTVVVSAGSLQTPVLLLKSGIQHPEIGRNLFLHPVVATAALYEKETLPWLGPMMSVVVGEFARLDGNWGYRIECPPVHPGLGALALSWESGEQIKTEILNLRRMAVHVCLVRDRFGGRVTVGKKSGEPVIHYDVHPYDRAHLVHAMQKSAELHAANGAQRVSILHNKPLHFFPKSDGSLEQFQTAIAAQNWGTNHAGVFSAHQMGTCRMGGTKNYPVQPDGKVRGVQGLFVADASLFPSASGTNPMLSVQALGYYVGNMVK